MDVSVVTRTVPTNLIELFKNSDPVVKRNTKPMLKRLQYIGAGAASRKTPVDRATLRRSLFIGHKDTYSYVHDWDAAIGSKLVYAPVQDSIKRWKAAGVLKKTKWWPNVTALREWVRRVIRPPAGTENSIAFLIGRKFAQGKSRMHKHPANFMLAAEVAIKGALPVEGKAYLKRIADGLARGR